jgi:regulator of RNase E activity RraA
MYPELGALVGYAVTCVYGLPDPNYAELSFLDVIDVLDASKKPTILVFEQKFPPEIANKVGLAGGNMTSAMKAVGCIGAISNGPSRDLDEIRPMKFQYLLSGITPGHGAMALRAINVPVSVGGMDVAPGELIHMDENGACKFPADKLEAVVKNVQALRDEEADRIGKLANATSAKQVRAIFSGHSYAEDDE